MSELSAPKRRGRPPKQEQIELIKMRLLHIDHTPFGVVKRKGADIEVPNDAAVALQAAGYAIRV